MKTRSRDAPPPPPEVAPIDSDDDSDDDDLLDALLASGPVFSNNNKPTAAARGSSSSSSSQQESSRASVALQNAMASLESQRLQNKLMKEQEQQEQAAESSDQQASTASIGGGRLPPSVSLTTTVKKCQQRTRDERDGVLGMYRDHAELEFEIYTSNENNNNKKKKKKKRQKICEDEDHDYDHDDDDDDNGSTSRRRKTGREVIADRKRAIDERCGLPLGSLLTVLRRSRGSSEKQQPLSLQLYTTYDDVIEGLNRAIDESTNNNNNINECGSGQTTTTTTIITNALRTAQKCGKIHLSTCLDNMSLVQLVLREQQAKQQGTTSSTTIIPTPILNWLFVLAASKSVGNKLANGACKTLLGFINNGLLSDDDESFFLNKHSNNMWQYCRDTIGGMFLKDFRNDEAKEEKRSGDNNEEGDTTTNDKESNNSSSGSNSSTSSSSSNSCGRTYLNGLYNLLQIWKAYITSSSRRDSNGSKTYDDTEATSTATSRLVSDLLLLLLDESLHCRKETGGDHNNNNKVRRAAMDLLKVVLDHVAAAAANENDDDNKENDDGIGIVAAKKSSAYYQDWISTTVSTFWEEDLEPAIDYTEEEREKIQNQLKHYDDYDQNYEENKDEALKYKVHCHLIQLLLFVTTTTMPTTTVANTTDTTGATVTTVTGARNQRQRQQQLTLFELQRAVAKKALEHCCDVSDFDRLTIRTVQRQQQQQDNSPSSPDDISPTNNKSSSSLSLATVLLQQGTPAAENDAADVSSSCWYAMAYCFTALQYLDNKTSDTEFVHDRSRVYAIVFGAIQSFLAGWKAWNNAQGVICGTGSSSSCSSTITTSNKQQQEAVAEMEVELFDNILCIAQGTNLGNFFNKNYHSEEMQRTETELSYFVTWLVELRASSASRAPGISSKSKSTNTAMQQSVAKYFKVKSPTK